jgi:eukaryotic-like serine/threonine-protein kinase
LIYTGAFPLERTAESDRYRILAPIGKGGMGEVFRARDTRLERDVAVKMLPPSVAADADRLRRLEQEARAAGQINHPNVVAVYDVASVNGGTAIVSELLEGETLGQRLARGRIAAGPAVRYGVQIAEGLAAAHRRGLVHRDLKPDNIFITTDGDRAKILDFGLAETVEPIVTDGPTQTQPTSPRAVAGTIGYMSPEQVRGAAADQRSDIFSFGVVLFEMLSGRRAFRRESAADTMSAILNEEPPELSGEQPGLIAILRRCLAKNPDARYQSARDLAFHLEQLSSFSGPLPVEPHRPEKRWPYAAVLIFAALVVAGFVWQITNARPASTAAPRTSSVAVVPFANVSRAPEAEYFSDGMTEELITALSRVEGLRVVARSSSFALKGKEDDARAIAKKLGVDHLLEGSVRQTGNRLRITAQLVDGSNGNNVWSETYDREILDVFRIQEEISREIAARLSTRSLASPRGERVSADEFAAYDLYLRAKFLFNQAMTNGSEPMLERSVALFEQAIARNPRSAAAYSGLANAYTHFEAVGASNLDERHRKAAAAARKALELDPNLAEAHVALGDVLFHHENDIAGGEREFRRAIELAPNLAEAHYYYSYLLTRDFRFEEAIAQGRLAVHASPLEPESRISLGFTLTLARRYEEAIAVLEEAMKIDPQSAFALHLLAVAHSMHGDHEKAVAEYDRFTAMNPTHPMQEMVHAWIFARAGRREEATKILNRVLSYPPAERNKACHGFGGTYIALGDNERALQWLKTGVEAGTVTWFEVKSSPWFDALRSDPRFTALIEQAVAKEKSEVRRP